MKKTYQSPSTDMLSVRMEGQLLGGVSAGTKDPEEGGDPTERGTGTLPGGTATSDPIGAKAGQLDQEDFNEWDAPTK